MPRNIIVIGGSAGSIETLVATVKALPPAFPASVFALVHMGPNQESHLVEILNHGPLIAIEVSCRRPIQPGSIYVPCPDNHMLVENGFVYPWRGPKEDRNRPAINPLFRSAAEAYGPSVIGVVLSGLLQDGSAGLWNIKQRGGIAVVQDPASTRFFSMPESVLKYVEVDYLVEPAGIAPLLIQLTADSQPVPEPIASGERLMETKESVDIQCPDCRGPLSEIRSGKVREFRCLVGHSFSPHALLQAHAEAEENALWGAVAALEESGVLIRRLLPDVPPEEATRLKEQLQKRLELAQAARAVVERLETIEPES